MVSTLLMDTYKMWSLKKQVDYLPVFATPTAHGIWLDDLLNLQHFHFLRLANTFNSIRALPPPHMNIGMGR